MFKKIIVGLLLHFTLQIESLYAGEDCTVHGKYGICIPLRDCKPIDDEVRRSGNPMPPHMRKKLQEHTCGFNFMDPLICCIPVESNTEKPNEAIIATTTSVSATFNNGNTNSIRPGDDNGDNVEEFTRRSVDNRNGPPDIEGHRNINLLPQSCGNMDADRIYRGNKTQLFEMPWMALLSYRTARGNKFKCGGTIINENYILTAAHCVSFLGSLQLNSVILGEHDTTRDPDCEIIDSEHICAPSITDATIQSVKAHPGYTPNTWKDDIALIRLEKPADFSLKSVKPICLPITRELQMQNLDGKKAVAAGWGATETTLPSSVLLSVDLPVMPHKTCQEVYNRTIAIGEGQLCAGGITEKDSCSGDSGGPLLYPGRYGKQGVRYIQHGIVSFGPRICGVGLYPGVYTNVALYMDWILDNIRG